MQSDLATHIQDDGSYYVLPGMHQEKRIEYSFAVRQDIMDALHIATPKTLDDFYQMLKTMKAAYPTKYPLSDRFNYAPATEPGGNLIRSIAAGFGVRAGWDYDTVSWNYDTNKYEVTASSDGYKQTLQYLNKLVTEGLLDPESFTQQDDAAIQKLARGDSFVISSNTQNIVDYRKNAPPGAVFKLIAVPTGPFGDRVFGGRLENGIALRADVKDDPHFVALMQFVDWLWFSDAGQEFAKFGQEGTTYTKSADGKITLDPGITMGSFNVGAPKQLQKDFGVWNGAFVYGGSTALMHAGYTPEEAAFYTAQLDGRTVLPLSPPAPFNENENEQATLIRTPLMDHVMKESLKFILGTRPFSDWDKFVSEVNGLGANDYLKLVNDAQARFAQHG
jgi:putative aldouronate transport system substrate-binding protein